MTDVERRFDDAVHRLMSEVCALVEGGGSILERDAAHAEVRASHKAAVRAALKRAAECCAGEPMTSGGEVRRRVQAIIVDLGLDGC